MGPAGSPGSTVERDVFPPLIRPFEPADFDAVCSLEEEGSGSRYGSRVFIRQASVLFSPFFFVAESAGYGHRIRDRQPDRGRCKRRLGDQAEGRRRSPIPGNRPAPP